MLHPFKTLTIALLIFLVPATQTQAQGLFAPVITINESVVTGFELDQRQRFLRLLGAPDPLSLASEQLIEDRLKIAAAKNVGIRPTQEELDSAVAEFAGRRNLTTEGLLETLASDGIAPQTLRDFVRAGLAWRQYVQTRFGARAGAGADELDRVLTTGADGSSIRVALNEIVIPIPKGREAEVSRVVEQIVKITTIEEFQRAARQVSAAPSRAQGGALGWRMVSDLPGPIQSIVIELTPGEVSRPLPVSGAVALFQMRAMEEVGYNAPPIAAVEYATVRLAGGNTAETRMRASILAEKSNRCDDLYGLLKDQDPSMLERISVAPEELPSNIAIELARLDPGEASFNLTADNGTSLLMVMLCSRVAALREGEARETLVLGLRNQRLETLAESHLAQLRAEAHISFK